MTAAARSLSAAAVLRAALRGSITRLRRNEAIVRETADAEAIHQARVALRHVRSYLKTFRPLVNKRWADALRREAGALARRYGAVRDLDVFLERVHGRLRRIPIADRRSALRLITSFEKERARQRDELADAVRGREHQAQVRRLASAAAHPPSLKVAQAPARDPIPPLLRERWRAARRAARTAMRTSADNDLHRLRIRVKRCRYAVEAAAVVIGKPAEAFVTAAGNVQDVLGDLHDAIVAQTKLRAHARGEDAFAAGQLAVLVARQAAKSRARWRRCWRALVKESARLGEWL